MKKLLLLFIFTLLAVSNSYSFGIGSEGGYVKEWNIVGHEKEHYANWQVGLSLGLGSATNPEGFMGIRYTFQEKGWGLGLHYDYPFLHAKIASWLYFFMASGVGYNFSLYNENFAAGQFNIKYKTWAMELSFRLPVGFRFVIAQTVEIFVQADPDIGIGVRQERARVYENNALKETAKHSDFNLFGGVGGTLGIRFWF